VLVDNSIQVSDSFLVSRRTVLAGGCNYVPRGNCLTIFGAGLLLKIALIVLFPALYGGDTVLHLRNHQSILLGHQPPMLQILIFASYKITAVPMFFRGVMALIGAAAGAGFYLLCGRIVSQEAAFWAALFFVSNPFLNEISIVPFQEILMLGALCFCAYFYAAGQIAAASLLLGIACLTRYEAWIACPMLLLHYWACHRFEPRKLLPAFGLFCWAPLLWLSGHLGLSSPGTYVIEMPRSALRLVRWLYLVWVSLKGTPVLVVLLSLLGLYAVYKRRLFRQKAVFFFGCFAGVFLVAVLCSAHGVPRPGSKGTESFVTSREATLIVGYILLLAGMGVEYLLQTRRQLAVWLGGTAVVLGIAQSAHFVAKQTSQPDVALSYSAARYLSTHVSQADRVLVLAKAFTENDWKAYLQKIEQLDGERGLAEARSRLRQADLSPISFQRIAVQTSVPERQLSASADPASVQWIVVWSNYTGPIGLPERLRRFRQAKELHAGSLQVRILRRLRG
jgi:hypothetical protein